MKALERFPETVESDWHQVNNAWIHKDANIADCKIYGGIFRSGDFRGGTFHGGTFRDGTFHGGVFRDGTFHGGVFYGGVFRGGIFRGGVFHGGVFEGGTFHGGIFHGGTFRVGIFRGGTFRGGIFHGGTFRGGVFSGTCVKSPLYLVGLLPWDCYAADGKMVIGCCRYSIDHWKKHLPEIAAKHGAKKFVDTIRNLIIPLFEGHYD